MSDRMVPARPDAGRPDAAARTVVRCLAPAKLNLYLHVTGRRPDGYHLLDGLVAFAATGDRLAVTAAPELRVAVEGTFAAGLDGADNLVARAARGLARLLDRAPAVAIDLEKNLPVASGIGGGSADAAATLRALCDLWQASPAEEDLAALALSLGADVPACLHGRSATMQGVGEVLKPAPALPPVALVLVNPGVPLATPSVFKAFDGRFSAADPITVAPRDVGDLAAALATRRNDLERPAIALVPAIADVLAALRQAGAVLARMSGSGATCFGLFADRAAAQAAASRLAAAEPAWWVVPSHLAGAPDGEAAAP
ncbi:4-(cytidine 5'-diphospho)-2-C-methyl-D-erythritol kinase [Zavarzinia sp. CC-PAN008]|uniref:4-(cytidine 5'-diphospho)-2-C-methyl-D-erythritol kinase n=1 Tax=Zavarzinia sp. CC-PAN008 TaxID=3243332 RepID=UPI003F7496F5